MDSEPKRNLPPIHHIASEFPELEDRQFLREALEGCYRDRAIYRSPRLPKNYARQVLKKSGREDILINSMSDNIVKTFSSTPCYMVPTTNLLLYGKAVREALRLYAEKVLLPQGHLAPEGVPAYVKERVHTILSHERDHAAHIPKDAWQKGVRSYFKIGYYTACEVVEGQPGSGFAVHVEERLAPSVLIMDEDMALSGGDYIDIISAPGEDMSDTDKQMLDDLRQRLEGLQK